MQEHVIDPLSELSSTPFKRGKVKDIYELDSEQLLFVFTDRVSAYDIVLPSTIPRKGEVLCKLAEEIAVNLRTGLGNVNKQCNFLCSRHRRSHSHSEQGQAGKK